MKKYYLFLGFSALLLTSSCVTKKQFDAMTKQRDVFFEEKEKAEKELKNARALNAELSDKNADLEKTIEGLKSSLADIESKYNQLKKEHEDLKNLYEGNLKSSKNENQKLLKDLNDKENRLRALEDDLREREKRIKELEDILQAQKDAVTNLRDKLLKALGAYADKGLRVYEKDGRVYVSLDEKLLFQSGKTEVNADGIAALNDLAVVLAQDDELQITVEGHTDNVPLKGNGPIKDNWDLSVLRATAVTKILMNNPGIEANQIIPAGRGEFMPVGSNETKEGRALNRRTEIIITPNFNELLKLINDLQTK